MLDGNIVEGCRPLSYVVVLGRSRLKNKCWPAMTISVEWVAYPLGA